MLHSSANLPVSEAQVQKVAQHSGLGKDEAQRAWHLKYEIDKLVEAQHVSSEESSSLDQN